MKVYKYKVNQITPRGKHINVFEKVVQSEMSYSELSGYLVDKYTGFTVYIEEVKEIETIGSTNKRTYMSYEEIKPNTKPIQEGYYRRGGVNPPPPSQRPNFTPPPQKPKGRY